MAAGVLEIVQGVKGPRLLSVVIKKQIVLCDPKVTSSRQEKKKELDPWADMFNTECNKMEV